ncbi:MULTISPECIES: HigA family addiction module antitoxin [Limosilactobacillus]|jgi:addiction module HigA family antidote|uniref:HigA family addiction module antitoxin n=1 Tax=Limosilactobacillus TaxID=2742598 RepID=UPI002264D52B|nr:MULTISPECIES: HigA family addiction module antitoxin [Limosilactobacillus]MCH3922114.1 HigA family addiction module antitoxin [Limosilactobacillus sp.]MCH3928885.1 HigA family addiction module antitoxin [Limosilactobacillus sp.]
MLHRENRIRQYHLSSAADLISEVMQSHNVTQADLAKRLGISQKNVSDILNRKRYLTETTALRIEHVMGISSELLLKLDANYKLRLAKENNTVAKPSSPSSIFLKRYSWA